MGQLLLLSTASDRHLTLSLKLFLVIWQKMLLPYSDYILKNKISLATIAI